MFVDEQKRLSLVPGNIRLSLTHTQQKKNNTTGIPTVLSEEKNKTKQKKQQQFQKTNQQ